MLFINDDQSQISHRTKDCRAGSHNDLDVSLMDDLLGNKGSDGMHQTDRGKQNNGQYPLLVDGVSTLSKKGWLGHFYDRVWSASQMKYSFREELLELELPFLF